MIKQYDHASMFMPLAPRDTVSIRDQMARTTFASLAKQAEDEIRKAADELLPPGWTLNDIAERFTVDPAKEDATHEVFRFDGQVVLELGPIRSEMRNEGGSYIMSFKRDVKRYR